MPTDSNASPLSSSSSSSTVTTVVTPTMSSGSSLTMASITTSISSASHSRPPSPPSSLPKELTKLKSFLSTLYYFGSDVSSETGERVRGLILALVNNALSVEEFHGKVQSATNFPLRPFALPFLKSTLPLLQKDLGQLARQSKQSTSQYLSQHEELILLPRESLERSTSPANSQSKGQITENGKRKLSDESHHFDERPYATKRASATYTNQQQQQQQQQQQRPFIPSSLTNTMITTATIRRDFREKERAFTAYLREYGTDFKELNGKNADDDWKNAENMLNCILEMVTKTKRVLFVLQQKDSHFRRLIETNDLEWRRRHAELLAKTEDRIVEVRRKAEEAVIEIKRQSIVDLQKAVSQTEQKSNEILIREREQYQRLNQELKAQTIEEAFTLLNRQEDGPEQCWHCGRKAIETCSGCNLARYCGQYCQHRDWEQHQKMCGPDLKRKYLENPQLRRRSYSKSSTHSSLTERRDESSISIPQRTSNVTPSAVYLNVSSPQMVMVNNGIVSDTLTANDEDETLTVKTEHL